MTVEADDVREAVERELRELMLRATPGPWKQYRWPALPRPERYDHLRPVSIYKDEGHTILKTARGERSFCDADLVTAMRNTLPALLDRLAELRAENERLKRKD